MHREYIMSLLERSMMYDPFKLKDPCCEKKLDSELPDKLLRSLEVRKEFSSFHKIRSLDFTIEGDILAAGCTERIELYDVLNSRGTHTYPTKKYGAEFIKFLRSRGKLLHTSTKQSHDVRLLSLNSNKYTTNFIGHTKRVISLSTPCNNDNMFASASMDKTVRLWDLRIINSHGSLEMPGGALAACDPEGTHLAVAVPECIKIFDLRELYKGPLFHYIPHQTMKNVNGIKYSNDGNKLAVTFNNAVHLLESEYLRPIKQISGFCAGEYHPIEASFTPDSRYLISGGTNGSIHIYQAEDGKSVISLETITISCDDCVKVNPAYMMLATASASLRFWLPNIY